MLNYAKSNGCVDLCPPVRNRYFYGKLLDVAQFDVEQSYLNGKRWLLNRLVSGWGVICGLNVQLGPDNQSIVVISRSGHRQVRPRNHGLPPVGALSAAGAAAAAGHVHVRHSTGAGTTRSGQMLEPMAGLPELWRTRHRLHLLPRVSRPTQCRRWAETVTLQSLCSPGAITERYKVVILPRGLCSRRGQLRVSRMWW